MIEVLLVGFVLGVVGVTLLHLTRDRPGPAAPRVRTVGRAPVATRPAAVPQRRSARTAAPRVVRQAPRAVTSTPRQPDGSLICAVSGRRRDTCDHCNPRQGASP